MSLSLREILEGIVQKDTPVLLNDGSEDWDAHALLASLSERMLQKRAYLQPGLYIAEINSEGYLGQVLYKIKQKG